MTTLAIGKADVRVGVLPAIKRHSNLVQARLFPGDYVALFVLSFLLPGLATFAISIAFFATVPRLGGDGKSRASFILQWALILTTAMPAIFLAIFGPFFVYTEIFQRDTSGDSRIGLAIGGCVLLPLCIFAALRSPPGRTYAAWRVRVD